MISTSTYIRHLPFLRVWFSCADTDTTTSRTTNTLTTHLGDLISCVFASGAHLSERILSRKAREDVLPTCYPWWSKVLILFLLDSTHWTCTHTLVQPAQAVPWLQLPSHHSRSRTAYSIPLRVRAEQASSGECVKSSALRRCSPLRPATHAMYR